MYINAETSIASMAVFSEWVGFPLFCLFCSVQLALKDYLL